MSASAEQALPGNGDDGAADISDEQYHALIFAVNFLFDFANGFLGTVFNVVNAVVFTRMGLSDTTNISLLGLAVADIGVSLTLVCYSVVYSPMVLNVVSVELITAIVYSTQGTCHILFSRIAGCLTAFITVERLLCVAFPLHIRSIVRPRRTSCLVVLIYVILTACTVPFYVAHQIGSKIDQESNKTTYGLFFAPHADQLEGFTLTVDSVAQMTSCAVVIVSTLGLIRSLLVVSKWRSSAISAKSSPKNLRSRDKQLVKMTLIIASVFIVCSLPTVIGNLVMWLVKDFNIVGRYKNIFRSVMVIFFAIDSIYSTINIFIYYKMSSKFRENIKLMFKLTTKKRL